MTMRSNFKSPPKFLAQNYLGLSTPRIPSRISKQLLPDCMEICIFRRCRGDSVRDFRKVRNFQGEGEQDESFRMKEGTCEGTKGTDEGTNVEI